MLTRARGVAVTLAVAAASLLWVATPATADHGGAHCETMDTDGNCVIQVQPTPTDPPTTGDGDKPQDTGDQGPACYWDPAPQGLTGPPAGPVPCQSEYGYWSNAWHCYVRALDPPPPPSDPVWKGNYPEGAVYQCYQPQTDIDIPIWSANPPPGVGGGPTPYEVAQMAIARMGFKAGDIGIVPEPGPGKLGIVGMPTWMWVKNPGPPTTGPITASASAGGITVTATAELDRIEWDMGDGTTVTCEGTRAKGTPYNKSYGDQDSPTCGHRYKKTSGGKPNNAYTVTANAYWVVNWSGAGQTGTITLDPLTRSVQIRVGEMQVLQQH